MVLHRVVASHLASVLEAQDLGEAEIGTRRAIGRFGMLGLHGEAGVVAGREVRQHRRGLVDGPSVGQATAVTSRSWKVPAARSTRPLACGEGAKICRIPSSCNDLVNWVASAAVSGLRALCLNTACRSLYRAKGMPQPSMARPTAAAVHPPCQARGRLWVSSHVAGHLSLSRGIGARHIRRRTSPSSSCHRSSSTTCSSLSTTTPPIARPTASVTPHSTRH